MIEEADLNTIVSNIISRNHISHCRLCLKAIDEEYVRFTDSVSLYPSSGIFQPLSEVLGKLLGENVCDDIPGIEVVCTDCVDSTMTVVRFLDKCKNSTDILNLLFENLLNTVSVDIDTTKNDSVYLIINDLDSKIIPMEKLKKNLSDHSHRCLQCDEFFENAKEVYVHNFSVHNIWTCVTCAATFVSEYELNCHETQMHKYKCSKCSQFSHSVESLSEHQDRIHNLHICKVCGKTCQGLNKLNSHKEKHKSKNSCPKCGKQYTTKEFYEKHVDLCLNNLIDPHPIRSTMEKSYTCEKCDKGYSTPGGLRVHNRFVHGNAKPHVCLECGKQFTAPSYLKVHMIKHTGEKNFKCEICNNRFVTKEALLYHTRRHTGEKPYSCKLCQEKFVNASARAEHIKFKHIGPTLMCEICSRKFVTAHFLKQHVSRHHDPTSNLYYGRNTIPPNLPVQENMRKYIIT